MSQMATHVTAVSWWQHADLGENTESMLRRAMPAPNNEEIFELGFLCTSPNKSLNFSSVVSRDFWFTQG